jgi:FAD/FMN-containing dehydrogenase
MVPASLAIQRRAPEVARLENTQQVPWPVAYDLAEVYKVYVVNATEVTHIQAAVRFAKANNIALVLKNTGHSYTGR